LKSSGHGLIQLKPTQNVVQRAGFTRRDLEEVGESIGESLIAIREQVSDYFTGFWELTDTGTHVWHQGAPGAYVHTGRTRRDWFGVSHPVYRPNGFWEITLAGAYVWHAGDPDPLQHTNTGQNRQDQVGIMRPVYRSQGFAEMTAPHNYVLRAGIPDPNVFVNTNQTRHSYPVYRTWLNAFREWLTNHGMNVVNQDPGRGRRARALYGGDTYKFWWFNSVQLYGGTYGLGADLHFNGNMGSCWLKGGPPNIGFNAQNNPIAGQMQDRLRRLAKFGWATQDGGQSTLIPYIPRSLKPAWIDATV
jgi:hypothetical protein